LAHHAQPAKPGYRAGLDLEVAGDHAQQGRLARAVGPHQGNLRPLAHTERDIGEELPTIRQSMAHTRDVYVPHGGQSCLICESASPAFHRSEAATGGVPSDDETLI